MQDVLSSSLHRILQNNFKERKLKFIMKKKIIATILAVSAMMSTVAFAENINANYTDNVLSFEQTGENIAVVSCYDENGKLCYSNMYKSNDGKFSADLPEQYKGMKTKVYFVNSKEIKDVSVTDDVQPTLTPSVTVAPTTAPTATEKPSATVAPTTKPSTDKTPSIYEKEVDAVYAPAVVKEVETTTKDGEDMYAVTLLVQGKEVKTLIENDVTFETSSTAYSFMKGKDAVSLEEGDVICLTANVAGTRINHIYFIYRPQDEDIITSSEDFGTNFENLITENGSSVANQWKLMKYGEKASSDRYQYAFGLVGKVGSNSLTLINKSGSTDKVIEVDTSKDTMVYTCDVSNKNEVEIASVGDITSTIPKSTFDKDETIDFTNDYSYNYALVRVVDGTATDIVVYENYND